MTDLSGKPPRRVKRYSNPALAGGKGLYAPARGIELAGDFYLGGERVPASALDPLSADEINDALALLHGDDLAALEDFVLRPAPTKDVFPREPRKGGWRKHDIARQVNKGPSDPTRTPLSLGEDTASWQDEPLPNAIETVREGGRMRRRAVSGQPLTRSPLTPTEGRANVFSAGDFMPDEEAMTMSPLQAQSMIDLFNESVPVAELVSGAKLGRAQRGWYRRAAFAIWQMFGEDSRRFAALLAATSPQKSVVANLNNALHIWAEYCDARQKLGRELSATETRAWAEQTMKKLGGRPKEQGSQRPYLMANEIKNVVRAIVKGEPGTHGHLSGPKVGSFGPNLTYDPNNPWFGVWHVTNDTWQALFSGVSQKRLQGAGREDEFGPLNVAGGAYSALSVKVRMATRLLNQQLQEGEHRWTPREVQETVWSLVRALAYQLGRDRHALGQQLKKGQIDPRSAARQARDPAQALRSLTHETVSNNADFVPLLLDNETLTALVRDRLGLGADLDKVRATHEGEQELNPPPSGPVLAGVTDPTELVIAGRVARRSGVGTGKFMTATAQYRKAPRRARRYAYPRDYPAYWRRPFRRNQLTTWEERFLTNLAEHRDPDVREMATQVLAGNTDALLMLYDALLDAGEPTHSDTLARLADLGSYAAGNMSAISDVETIRRRKGLPTPRDVSIAAQHAHIDQEKEFEATQLESSRPQFESEDHAARWAQMLDFMASPRKGSYHKPPRRVRRYADEALIGASSNTEKEMSFDEAFKRVSSGDQAGFKQMASDMAAKVGLKARVDAAVGDWEDGAEHSVLTQIPDAVDMDTLRYVGAWQGLAGNQRSVLIFRPEQGGLDSVYTIQVPETDASKVRAQLSQFGVPYRTIVPDKKGTRVVVYDQKRSLRQNVSNFAQLYHAPVRETLGSGEYVGGSTRAAARAAYRKVIAEFEARQGRGRPLPPGQAAEHDRGRRAKTA